MALRDQPYLPLYIQDFLTDEKLIECTAQAHGVYIRLMCIMHKSEQYGKILLKQKDKQTGSMMKDFAQKLAKAMPWSSEVIEAGLSELILEKVIYVDENSNYIYQPRMIKDNDLSEKRALAGQKSQEGQQKKKVAKGFATAKDSAKLPATQSANTEYEIETAIEVESETERHFFEKYENPRVFGDVPQELIDLAKTIEPREKAGDWQVLAQMKMTALGYFVRREVPVEYPDGTPGRVDLVASKDGIEVAIELDYRTPRKNSIVKLGQFPNWMIWLRDPKIIKQTETPRALRTMSGPEITAEVFSDEIFISTLQMAHRGKDLQQAWRECYAHFMSDPRPPTEVYEWKKKLNTWLTNKPTEKKTSKKPTFEELKRHG